MLKWFNNIKVRNKLIGSFLAMIAILAIVFAISWNAFNSLDSAIHQIANEQFPKHEVVRDLVLQVAFQEEHYFAYASTLDEDWLDKARKDTTAILGQIAQLKEDLQGEPELLATLEQAEAAYQVFEQNSEQFAALYAAGEPEQGVEKFYEMVAAEDALGVHVDKLALQVKSGVEQAFLDAQQTDTQATQMIIVVTVIAVIIALGVTFLLTLSIAKPLVAMTEVGRKLAVGDVNQTVEVRSRDEVGQMADAFRQMITYQQEMAETADQLAQGNLTVNVSPQSEKDALGNAFSQMIANLRGLIGQVQQNAGQVANASQQLNASAEQTGQASQQVIATIQQVAEGTNQQTQSITEAITNVEQMARATDGIAQGTQEQARGVQKTSDLINEMDNIVEQVGQVTNSVTSANVKVTQAARQGVTAVGQTSQGMDTIRVRTADAAKKVKEMGNRSKEIGRIVETIDEIADKTDMLALNAAVEAARAGEHGRGFAVVADQVRKLSEDSKSATRNIDELIETVQETINEAIAAMESTAAEVDNGTQLAADTTQSLQEILQAAEEAARLAELIGGAVADLKAKSVGVVTAMEMVSTVVEENSASAEEMASNSQQVTTAMEGLASVAEQNSASTEEMSASAEEMSAQIEEVVASAEELWALADDLHNVAAQFRLAEPDQMKQEQSRPVDLRASQQQPVPTPANGQGDGHRIRINR